MFFERVLLKRSYEEAKPMEKLKVKRIGIFLLTISTYLLSIAVPTSIALGNTAIGIGAAGILLLLVAKDYKNYPDYRILLPIIIPDILTMLSQFSLGFLRMSSIKQHLLAYFIPYKTLKEKKIFDSVITILGVASIVLFLALLFETLTWQNIVHVNFHRLSFHHHYLIRARGLFSNALTTSSVVTLLLFFYLGLFLSTKKPKRAFYLLVSILSLFSLILTQSRSSWLGFLFASALFVVFSLKKGRSYVYTIFALALLFSFIIYSNQQFRERFLYSFKVYALPSNFERVALWLDYIKTFKQYDAKQKLFGAGSRTRKLIWQNFKYCYEKVVGKRVSLKVLKNHFFGGASHNIYLRYLGETGIVGLLGFLIFWIYLLYINFKAAKGENGLFFISMNCGYIAFLVIGFFENNFVDATVNIALMFIISLNFYILSERS